jgi:hypothetical protein
VGRDLSARLVDYSRTCQSYIQQMDSERRRVLAEFVREVVARLEQREDLASS